MDMLSGLTLFIQFIQFIHKMSQDKKVYSNIINSLFPTIHGSDEVKRGIVGVPIVRVSSTAKSHFLKFFSDF